MSDDLEDVSVVETVETTPSAEPAPAPVDIPVETSSEPVHADEQVFTTSTRIGTAEDANRQQVAAENGAIHGNGDVDGRTVTEAGRQAKAADQEEKKEAFSRAQEHAEALRKEWMERDHDFGGIKMSGHDLAKMIDFISNPQMQDKLRERLGKSGMPKEKIDKGMKELNEYIELKKKEQEGQKLTEEQQRRLKELEKSEEFKVVAQEATNLANQQGLKITVKENKADANAGVTLKGESTSNVDDLVAKKIGSTGVDASNTSAIESRSIAYAHFKAPDVAQKFDQAASGAVIPANNSELQIKPQVVATVSVAKVEAGNAALM